MAPEDSTAVDWGVGHTDTRLFNLARVGVASLLVSKLYNFIKMFLVMEMEINVNQGHWVLVSSTSSIMEVVGIKAE